MISPKKFKNLFSNLKRMSKNDAIDTGVRKAISEITEEIIQSIPKEYFRDMSKGSATILSWSAVFAGYLMRKLTNFGPFGDNIITDFSQEIADKIMEEYRNKGAQDKTKSSPADAAQRKIRMVYVAKIFINAGRIMSIDEVNKFFNEFNEMMEGMPEVNQDEFLETLSKFDERQVIDFMKCSKEQKQKFFSFLFTKVPEPKKKDELSHFEELKKWFKKAKEEIDSVLDKIDVIFADDRIGGHILNRIFKLKQEGQAL